MGWGLRLRDCWRLGDFDEVCEWVGAGVWIALHWTGV